MVKLGIQNIVIKGFKSIQSMPAFAPRAINVFIGQNGAGKSNFIEFFKFLSYMLSGTGDLAYYVDLNGGASNFLFDGSETTQQIAGLVSIKTTAGLNEYKFKLSHASGDKFIYTEEYFRFVANEFNDERGWFDLGSGHKESGLIHSESKGKTQGGVKRVLQQIITYKFNNINDNSPVKIYSSDVKNGWFLDEDGRNLSSVLLELSSNQPALYRKIISIIQQIIPFFDDFVLIEQYGKTYLRWKEKGSTVTFEANQASEGMLRAMSLVTLLCLPPKRMPAVLFLDLPELGLHPSAVKLVCELVHGASEHCQIFIATQNADILNEFEPEDVVVVTREGRKSVFNRMVKEDLSEWIGVYSLSDLWHQNIIGGKP